jgi:uncharacterized protein (TIRG00374 family)
MNRSPIKYRRLLITAIIAILIVGIIIIILDGKDFDRIIEGANWALIALALSTTAGALFFQCYSYVLINRAFGVNSGFVNLFEVGFASIAVGNVVSTPFSITEHSIRAALLVPQGFKFGDVVAASMFHSFIKDAAILILAPGSIIYQILTQKLPSETVRLLITLIALSLGAMFLIIFLFISKKFRGFFLNILGRLLKFIIRKSAQKQINDFDFAIEKVKRTLRRRPRLAFVLFFLMLGDWVCTLATLELCFVAFNIITPFTVLVSGFAAGKTATILSFIPGGIGVLPASAAGAFALFHVDFGLAFLVVALFQIVYNFIPYFASFIVFRFLFAKISR